MKSYWLDSRIIKAMRCIWEHSHAHAIEGQHIECDCVHDATDLETAVAVFQHYNGGYMEWVKINGQIIPQPLDYAELLTAYRQAQ